MMQYLRSLVTLVCALGTLEASTLNAMAMPRANPLQNFAGSALPIQKSVFGGSHAPLAPAVLGSTVLIEVAGPKGLADCTGVIISPKHIVTAAHCFDESPGKKLETRIIVGFFANEEKIGSARLVHKVFIPTQYRYPGPESADDYDLAVLVLKENIPITHWQAAMNFALPTPDDPIQVAGAGLTEFKAPEKDTTEPSHLSTVTVTSGAISGKRIFLRNSQKGFPYHGDSGAPLYQLSPDNMTMNVVGIWSDDTVTYKKVGRRLIPVAALTGSAVLLSAHKEWLSKILE